jgi:hypothetical protein
MKKNIIVKGTLGLLMVGAMTACSSDYLELEPTASVTDLIVTSTTEQAAYAVNGIAQLMIYPQGVSGTGYAMGNNGEAWFMTFYGDAMGQDYFQDHLALINGGAFIDMSYFTAGGYSFNNMVWGLYYSMIADCNRVLQYIDDAEESQVGERNQIKAELLTFRAHAYVRLMQLYGPRWSDSNNGERMSIVLRTAPDVGDSPLVSCNTVYDQIYSDLNTAIDLFQDENTAKLSRPNIGVPDLSVAYGVYARAALLKNDWQTARTMAHNARQGHTIMTADDWQQGFIEANDDYMWTNSVDELDIMYNVSWGAYNACNGLYPLYWSVGAGAMDRKLFVQIDENDIRRTRFLMPETVNSTAAKAEYWWNDKYIDLSYMNLYDMSNRRFTMALLNYTNSCTPTKIPSWASTVNGAYAPMSGRNETPFLQFGAQMKFYVADDSYQRNQFPFMRSTEFLLTEAEAAYMLGDESTARSLITELCSQRITGYTSCDKTGTALLDEIRLQRRIELWGEGTTFFDLKRWGLHNTRAAWVAGDVNSGNVPVAYANDIAPEDCNHWVMSVPGVEYNYNSAIDLSALKW